MKLPESLPTKWVIIGTLIGLILIWSIVTAWVILEQWEEHDGNTRHIEGWERWDWHDQKSYGHDAWWDEDDDNWGTINDASKEQKNTSDKREQDEKENKATDIDSASWKIQTGESFPMTPPTVWGISQEKNTTQTGISQTGSITQSDIAR